MSEQCVYIVKQYASTANRRELQLQNLANPSRRVSIVHQHDDSPLAYSGPCSIAVRKPRNPFGLFSRVGLHGLKRRLDGLYFPTPTVLYVRAAVQLLRQRVADDLARGRDVCVLTAVPPHDLLLAGLTLKTTHPQVRWVIDWQDLWSYDEYYFGRVVPKWRARALQLERNALRSCDVNVVTNHRAGEVLVAQCGANPDSIRVIPHAFETDDCHRFTKATGNGHLRANSSIRIGFLGNLFKPPKVPGEQVLATLELVRANGIDLTLHVFGDKYLEKVSRAPIQNRPWVEFSRMQSHERSLEAIALCDFLLLALADLPNTRVILHAKLPYYLALDRPVLALVSSDSAVADVIRQTGAGHVIDTECDWAGQLAMVLSAWRSGICGSQRNSLAIAQYTWGAVAGLWQEAIGPNCGNNSSQVLDGVATVVAG